MLDDLVNSMKKSLGLQPSGSGSGQAPFTSGRGHRLGTAAEAEAQRQAKVVAAAASRAAGVPPGGVAATSRTSEVTGPSRPSPSAAPRRAAGGGSAAPPERVAAAQPVAVKQTPPLTGAAVLLATNADGGAAAARLLARVLGNVVSDPLNDKYRSLRLSNPAVASAVVHSSGGLELLQQAGFLVRFEEPAEAGGEQAAAAVEGYATLELPPEEADRAAQLEAVLAALESLSPLLPDGEGTRTQAAAAAATAAVEPPKAGAAVVAGIPTVVWLPSASCAAALDDLPDEFFERTVAEVAAEAAQRRQKSEAALVVAPRRKQSANGPLGPAAPGTSAMLRIRMTDGTLLQGRFRGGDVVQAVYAWVADCLAQPRAFVLSPPRGLGAQASAALAGGEDASRVTLAQAGLCPSAVLTLRWGPEEGKVAGPVLRTDLMAQAVPLE